jgi:hypothetical protein
MPVLIDTNILLRTLQPANSHCAMAQRAIYLLRSRRETLWVCAQNIVEFWGLSGTGLSGTDGTYPFKFQDAGKQQ